MKINEQAFGQQAKLIVLENDNGFRLGVTDFGARIVDFWVPTASGEKNIVLGFDSAEEYQQKDCYIGATIGRVAGRITAGKFEINGVPYQAVTQPNQGNNTLHGGPNSFEEKYWSYETATHADRVEVTFSYESPDQENGFPGNLSVVVTYTLTQENEWRVSYQAKTDQATLFNPTNHVYFNLTGDVTTSVADHLLEIAADRFVVVDEQTTATGELRSVTDTPFDFQQEKQVGDVFTADYPQNRLVDGLDHPFVFREEAETPQVRLSSPTKDVVVEMTTTEPSVVIFTANFGENTPEMRGQKLANHGGITLETQVMPGAVEYEGFCDIILPPEAVFASTTRFKVSTNA